MSQFSIANGSFVGNNQSIAEVIMVANSTGGIINSFGGTLSGGLPSGANTIGAVTIGALPQTTVKVANTPTVTATSYAANSSIGGILTFASNLPSIAPYAGMLESITLKFEASLQTTGFYVAVFTTSPTGTFTSGSTVAIASTDSAYLVGVYYLTRAVSILGTHTIYNLDGIGKSINGSSANLYAVIVPQAATVALASTSDVILELAVIGG